MSPDRISGALLLLLAGAIVAESRRYPIGTLDYPGPGFLPTLLGAAIGLMALLLLAVSWRRAVAPSSAWPDRQGLIKVVAVFTGTLAYAALLELSGYLLNTFLLFVWLLRPVGRQTWTVTLGVSLAAALSAYLLFDVWLKVQLPRGAWFQ